MENEECKMVIVMRTDLNMRKGKMVAQGGHAVQLVLEPIYRTFAQLEFSDHTKHFRNWRTQSNYKKVCVGSTSKEELLDIKKQAEEAGLPFALVVDSGKTEFGGVPTETCLAIGPAPSASIDAITGKLKLL